MSKIHRGIVVGLLLAATLGASSVQVVEEIVAVVNDEVITLSQVRARHDIIVQALRAQLQGEEFEKQYEVLKKDLLERLITETLLLQLAKEKQLDVREQVKMNIENLKKQYNMESDEDLKLALAREGLEYDSWFRQMEEDMLRQAAVFQEVDRAIVIDDTETIAFYKAHPELFTEAEEYTIRAIYLSPEENSAEAIETLKAEIDAKLAAGEDFGALAGQYTQGPGKDNQGALGTFKKGELEPGLEKAVAGLRPGEVAAWLQGRNGWYLLKLDDKKPSRLKPFEEAKREVEERLFVEKKTKKLEEFLKNLKSKNYIKIIRPNPLEF